MARRPASATDRNAGAVTSLLPIGAVSASLPARLSPHLAVLGKAPSEAVGWIFEIKFDGYRMLAKIDRDVRLFTKNGHDWTAKLPLLRARLESMQLPGGWYDGEVVACDERGQPDFGRLQELMSAKTVAYDLAYYVFDLPYFLDHDLRRIPLAVRRHTLQELLAARPDKLVQFSGEVSGQPAQLLEAACEMRLEGLMCKRTDSSYSDGRRSTSWRKLKCRQLADLVIVGYTGARTLDKVLLGIRGKDGRLRYAGSVSNGLSEKGRADLRKALGMIAADESPFSPDGSPGYGKWVQPILLAEVSFAEWTKAGKVRHSVLHRVKAASS
jgi:bifunctional non-homologous end joining protein LigD